MLEYKKLEKQFEKAVCKLQSTCKHKKSKWFDHWWALGHYSGYRVQICSNCNMELAQDPTEEEREKIKKEWLNKEMAKYKGILH